jgi:hypothetical protein
MHERYAGIAEPAVADVHSRYFRHDVHHTCRAI